jgi:hypothetical protein
LGGAIREMDLRHGCKSVPVFPFEVPPLKVPVTGVFTDSTDWKENALIGRVKWQLMILGLGLLNFMLTSRPIMGATAIELVSIEGGEFNEGSGSGFATSSGGLNASFENSPSCILVLSSKLIRAAERWSVPLQSRF